MLLCFFFSILRVCGSGVLEHDNLLVELMFIVIIVAVISAIIHVSFGTGRKEFLRRHIECDRESFFRANRKTSAAVARSLDRV